MAEADHWCPAVCPALMGGVIIRDYHCTITVKLETLLFLEHTFPIPAFTATCYYPVVSSQPGTVKTLGDRVLRDTAVMLDEHLSVTSICFLKHWLWHFFRHNTREVTPERQNIIAFLRECFASVTCLSETISFGGSDENHIILEL